MVADAKEALPAALTRLLRGAGKASLRHGEGFFAVWARLLRAVRRISLLLGIAGYAGSAYLCTRKLFCHRKLMTCGRSVPRACWSVVGVCRLVLKKTNS